MAKIHFNRAQVVALVAHAKAAPQHNKLYDEVTGPGLWLVGDSGIYLMSNGNPPMAKDDPNRVVYCKQSDPTKAKDGDDEWYENKRRIFGGDDGVQFIPLAALEKSLNGPKGANNDPKAEWFTMMLSPRSMAV